MRPIQITEGKVRIIYSPKMKLNWKKYMNEWYINHVDGNSTYIFSDSEIWITFLVFFKGFPFNCSIAN